MSWRFDEDLDEKGGFLHCRVGDGEGQFDVRIMAGETMVRIFFDPPRLSCALNIELVCVWCVALMAAAQRVRPTLMNDLATASRSALWDVAATIRSGLVLAWDGDTTVLILFPVMQENWDLSPYGAAYLATMLHKWIEKREPGVTQRVRTQWVEKAGAPIPHGDH